MGGSAAGHKYNPQIKAHSVTGSQSSLVSGPFASSFLKCPSGFAELMGGEGGERSVTATGSDHHVAVLLEDYVGAVIKVEH